MRVLAISGSLRAASLNSALLRATARIAPPGIEVRVFDGIGQLPLFNPDLESADPPAVATLRTQIMAADALLIASPEYAHGVTAAIKNALDWMVGNESFVNKPVALFNASPRAVHAQAALRETLNDHVGARHRAGVYHGSHLGLRPRRTPSEPGDWRGLQEILETFRKVSGTHSSCRPRAPTRRLRNPGPKVVAASKPCNGPQLPCASSRAAFRKRVSNGCTRYQCSR